VPVNALGELGALVTGNCVPTSVGLGAAESGVSIVAKARAVAAAILFIIISPNENIIQIELTVPRLRLIEAS
jgi:hypothetical protein